MKKKVVQITLFFFILCLVIISIPIAFHFGMQYLIITILLILLGRHIIQKQKNKSNLSNF